jgi:hypothetical protein
MQPGSSQTRKIGALDLGCPPVLAIIRDFIESLQQHCLQLPIDVAIQLRDRTTVPTQELIDVPAEVSAESFVTIAQAVQAQPQVLEPQGRMRI